MITFRSDGPIVESLFMGRPHDRDTCPRCGELVRTTALVRLVYSFEPCECEVVEYVHLVERLWHRACYIDAGAP